MTDDLRFMADKLALWREHPAQMVRDLFHVEPDPWQEKVLELFPTKPRIAMKASKGVGKSSTEAWLIWNFLLTRSQPKIACVAISADNLADNLWTELAFWRGKSKLLIHLFEWTKTRIFAREHPETWWCSARSWAKTADASQQADTLAGLHADYIMFVLDESGGMPEAIMASAEAALSSCVEGHIVQAGNPTHLTGALYSACTRDRKLWEVVDINSDPDDPNRSPRVSKEWAQQQIDKYGRDNPWVLVNVFGQFPPSAFNSLIGRVELEESAARYYRAHQIGNAPKILGVDVALYGDDSSIVQPRWGLQCMPKTAHKGINSIQGAAVVARIAQSFGADAIFVDATGGFGAGWVDQLRVLGFAPIGIQFASKPHDTTRYANKRTEMYFDTIQWIKDGGAIPNDPTLIDQLAATTYTFSKDKLIIEPKDLIKARLGYSPDEADSLCFEAGTLIRTPLGQRRIEDLQVGDVVSTPFGETEIAVTWAHETSRITTVELSNGSMLRGRPEHKVFAFGHGQVRLDALTLTMELSHWSERHKWLRANAWFTKVPGIGFKTLAAILAPVSQSSENAFCIAAFGLRLTGQFRRVMTFIIETTTGATAFSTISRCLRRQTMLRSMQPVAALSALSKSASMDISRSPKRRQRFGMLPRLALIGISNTARNVGLTGNQWSAPASNVDRPFSAISHPEQNIAPNLARTLIFSSAIKQLAANAVGAAYRLFSTNTVRRSVVAQRVRTESAPPTLVYNLTLREENAYYANDILVFNCLTHAEPVLPKASKRAARHDAVYDPIQRGLDEMVRSSYGEQPYDPVDPNRR